MGRVSGNARGGGGAELRLRNTHAVTASDACAVRCGAVLLLMIVVVMMVVIVVVR